MRRSIKRRVTNYSPYEPITPFWIGDPFEWNEDLLGDPYYRNNDHTTSHNLRHKKLAKRRFTGSGR